MVASTTVELIFEGTMSAIGLGLVFGFFIAIMVYIFSIAK